MIDTTAALIPASPERGAGGGQSPLRLRGNMDGPASLGVGAIRQLRWQDIDFKGGTILWRAEQDKSGYEHVTPVTAEALAALGETRRRNPGTGEAPVLPAPRNPLACLGAARLHVWWSKAQILAGLKPMDRQGLALSEAQVCLGPDGPAAEGALPTRRVEAGQNGLGCYQRADEGQLRKALEDRRRARG